MRVVVALGGNALLERREVPDAEIQEHHVKEAINALAPLAREHELIVTHGNGPQVGVLASESASDHELSHPYPFDVVGAETQGMIGYWLLQALENALPGRSVASLVCQTVVDPDDPAFGDPTKFVGPTYNEDVIRRFATERGWQARQDGDGWRRVVASPEPKELVELDAIEALVANGTIVICSGGGGIPVIRGADGGLTGAEAVVDKDLTAAFLAIQLHADALLILTDVEAVERDYDTPAAKAIHHTSVDELRSIAFPAGSMGPKVEAVCRFVSATGHMAAIGQLKDAQRLLAKEAGTVVDH